MIQELIDFSRKLINGDLPVKAGQEFRISEASSIGDFVWQGDLKLTIIQDFNPEYTKIEPKEIDKQMVPGSTIGSKHCLDHLDVEYRVPKNWSRNDSYDDLNGPQVKFLSENRLNHNQHGPIIIPAGFIIDFSYQKNLDIETQKDIRARD